MTENRKFLAVLSVYVLLLIFIVSIGSFVIVKRGSEPIYTTVTETVTVTEKIFVWASPPETDHECDTDKAPTEERVWIIREYEGRIGVFSEDGALLDVIDIYTKTLPETDKNLLREGIRITSEQALRAIIEDYSD